MQATAKLKAAEQAGTAAERDAAAKEALAGLLRVPQCVNLNQMVGRLAFLRQYEVGLCVFAVQDSVLLGALQYQTEHFNCICEVSAYGGCLVPSLSPCRVLLSWCCDVQPLLIPTVLPGVMAAVQIQQLHEQHATGVMPTCWVSSSPCWEWVRPSKLHLWVLQQQQLVMLGLEGLVQEHLRRELC